MHFTRSSGGLMTGGWRNRSVRAPWLLVTLMLMVPMSGCMGDVVNLGPDPTST